MADGGVDQEDSEGDIYSTEWETSSEEEGEDREEAQQEKVCGVSSML